MGFFGKLFEKKECSICGGEIGLLGNKKLEDGNCCKDCAKKLSPWFSERRHSTVEQIRQQLAYRESNRQELNGFRPVKTYGERYELKVELAGNVPSRFVAAKTNSYLEENADLISFSQVTSFNIDIQDSYRELKYRNDEGEMVSYSPRRYEYRYDFYAEIHVNSPWFDEIRFRLNDNTLELETVSQGFSIFTGSAGFDPMHYPEYRRYKTMCDELEELFRAGMQGAPLGGYAQMPTAAPVAAPAAPAAAPAPQAAPKFCTSCGSPADGSKFCQNCGAPLR